MTKLSADLLPPATSSPLAGRHAPSMVRTKGWTCRAQASGVRGAEPPRHAAQGLTSKQGAAAVRQQRQARAALWVQGRQTQLQRPRRSRVQPCSRALQALALGAASARQRPGCLLHAAGRLLPLRAAGCLRRAAGHERQQSVLADWRKAAVAVGLCQCGHPRIPSRAEQLCAGRAPAAGHVDSRWLRGTRQPRTLPASSIARAARRPRRVRPARRGAKSPVDQRPAQPAPGRLHWAAGAAAWAHEPRRGGLQPRALPGADAGRQRCWAGRPRALPIRSRQPAGVGEHTRHSGSHAHLRSHGGCQQPGRSMHATLCKKHTNDRCSGAARALGRTASLRRQPRQRRWRATGRCITALCEGDQAQRVCKLCAVEALAAARHRSLDLVPDLLARRASEPASWRGGAQCRYHSRHPQPTHARTTHSHGPCVAMQRRGARSAAAATQSLLHASQPAWPRALDSPGKTSHPERTLLRVSTGSPVRPKKALASAPVSRPSPSQSASANQASVSACGTPSTPASEGPPLPSLAPTGSASSVAPPRAGAGGRAGSGAAPGCRRRLTSRGRVAAGRRCTGKGGRGPGARGPAGPSATEPGPRSPPPPAGRAPGASHACVPGRAERCNRPTLCSTREGLARWANSPQRPGVRGRLRRGLDRLATLAAASSAGLPRLRSRGLPAPQAADPARSAGDHAQAGIESLQRRPTSEYSAPGRPQRGRRAVTDWICSAYWPGRTAAPPAYCQLRVQAR